MTSRSILALAAAATLAGVSSAHASLLSVNFMADTNQVRNPVTSGPAGIVPDAAADWNNLTGVTNSGTVADDAGSSYGITWSSGGGWYTAPNDSPAADGNSQLMMNAIAPAGSGTTTFTLTGLDPGLTYKLDVYVEGLNPSNNHQSDTLGSTTYYSDFDMSTNWSGTGPYTFNGFTQVTSTDSSTFQVGNYVEYTGITDQSTLTFTSIGISGQSGVAGFQLESTGVPEPASIAVAGIGCGSLLIRRRRAERTQGR